MKQIAFPLILMLASTLLGCATDGGPSGMLRDTDAGRLEPGLAVLYFDKFYRHVSQIPEGDDAIEDGRPGPPVMVIDEQFGEDEVFDSGRSRGVGIQFSGFIHLETAGTYQFQALSNDGVIVFINGVEILSDPKVHPDRLSEIGTFTSKGGWYPLLMRYFQRKGTAALSFYWQPPGTDAFAPVPASAYGHLKTP